MPAERTSPVGDLVVEIAKALLRTGYYSAEHPEAQRSTAALLTGLREVTAGSELRLGAMSRPGGGEVLLTCEGCEDLPLQKIVSTSAAELFRPKLLDFMARRDLVSFSIHPAVEEAELLAFLELMTRVPTLHQREEARRLDRELAERGVRRVSVLFRGDLVGLHRRLSWGASLVLSRLSKELARPLPADLAAARIADERAELLAEQLRPLRDPQLLADILLNLDLVPELQSSRGFALSALSTQVRLALGQYLTHEVLHAAAGALPAGAGDLAGETVTALLEPEVLAAGTNLVCELLARRLLTEERVPALLREQVALRRRTDRWTEHLEESVAELEQDAARGAEAAQVLGELLRRGRHRDAVRVAAGLVSALSLAEARPLLRAALDPVAADLAAALRGRRAVPPVRAALLTLLALAGEDGEHQVRDYVRAARAERAALIEEVSKLGVESVEAVLRAALSREPTPTHLAEDLLPLAARHPSVGLVPLLARLTGHKAAAVRRGAVAALVPLGRAVAEDPLCDVLADPDGATRRLALSALASFGSRRLSVLSAMASTLLDGRAAPEARIAAASALGGLARSTVLPGNTTPEAVLVEALQHAPRGLRARLPSRAGPVHVAVCRALGRVGTDASLPALEAAARDGSSEVRAAARAVLETLRAGAPARG